MKYAVYYKNIKYFLIFAYSLIVLKINQTIVEEYNFTLLYFTLLIFI